MPELAEVETVVRTLENQLGIITIDDLKIFYQPIIETNIGEFVREIKNKTIIRYERLGKYLIFDLDTHHLIVHLRMEGKFYVQTKDEPVSKHTHVMFLLNNGMSLRYHDTRKFGRMYLYKKEEDITKYPCFKNVGYDLFDSRLNANILFDAYHKRNICVKQMLLDQSVMAGIGNIYADEICFACKMNPERKVSGLHLQEYEKILVEARRILQEAIYAGGTTIRSYTSSLGVDGRFQLALKVHSKEGVPCPICANIIQKKKVAGRGTYFCPTCQKK